MSPVEPLVWWVPKVPGQWVGGFFESQAAAEKVASLFEGARVVPLWDTVRADQTRDRLMAALGQAYMALLGYLPAHRNAVTDAAIEAARDAIATERARRDIETTLACRRPAAQELQELESEVRRVLGLTESAQEQGGSDGKQD